jgi:hypothetical protein
LPKTSLAAACGFMSVCGGGAASGLIGAGAEENSASSQRVPHGHTRGSASQRCVSRRRSAFSLSLSPNSPLSLAARVTVCSVRQPGAGLRRGGGQGGAHHLRYIQYHHCECHGLLRLLSRIQGTAQPPLCVFLAVGGTRFPPSQLPLCLCHSPSPCSPRAPDSHTAMNTLRIGLLRFPPKLSSHTVWHGATENGSVRMMDKSQTCLIAVSNPIAHASVGIALVSRRSQAALARNGAQGLATGNSRMTSRYLLVQLVRAHPTARRGICGSVLFVQGPCSVAPCQTLFADSQLARRCTRVGDALRDAGDDGVHVHQQHCGRVQFQRLAQSPESQGTKPPACAGAAGSG